jgi:GLPGLI family protein
MKFIKMRILFISFLTTLFVGTTLSAQLLEGRVVYEKTSYWTKIYSRLTFLSREEKDRIAMTYKNSDGYKTKMELFFTESKSLYTYPEEKENEAGYSWNNSEHIIYREFENDKRTEILELIGKTYIIDDSLNTPKWKIMNDIKEIQGHICMKAITQNTAKDQEITAWFASDIPVSAGPEEYFGLPGLILELDVNKGDVIITAVKLDLKPVSEKIKLPRKMKGKKITYDQYNTIIKDHISSSIKSYRNPYWSIPY